MSPATTRGTSTGPSPRARREPHVRDTISDRELELWLVVDASKSLDFGTARSEKRDVVWAAAGAFALLASRGATGSAR